MKLTKLVPFSFLVIFCLFSCAPEENELSNGVYTAAELNTLSARLNLPTQPFTYDVGSRDSDKSVNDMATLGRVLFYDSNLSADASVSCATCHQQKLAFSDDIALSKGANGGITKRNSIALGAVKHFGRHYEKSDNHNTPGLFWDERATSIKEQLLSLIHI